MKTCQFMLFLLFALQIVCLSAQTRLKRFEIITKEVSQFSISVEHPDCAVLSVYSAISGLQFESNMGKIKAYEHRPAESRYVIFLYPVKQKISVKCPGYIESEFPIFSNLIAKQQVSYEVNEAIGTQGKGSLSISSDPSGAEILIDGIPTAELITPHTFTDLLAMQYRISLIAYRHRDSSFVATVEPNRETKLNIRLNPAYGDLIISSSPSNARVYINDRISDRTPLTLNGKENGLEAGTYNIRLSLDRYKEVLKSITIKAGDIINESIQLEPLFGGLIVSSEPKGAKVFLNGKDIGVTPQVLTGSKEGLDIGTYSLRIVPQSDMFKEETCDITIQSGKTETKEFNFVSAAAGVKIESTLKPFQAYLDGTLNEDLSAGRQISVAAKQQQLKVIYTGDKSKAYSPYEETLQLRTGEIHTVNPIFKSKLVSVGLSADLPYVKFSVFGKDSSIKECEVMAGAVMELIPGSYNVIATKQGYLDHHFKLSVPSVLTAPIQLLRQNAVSLLEPKSSINKPTGFKATNTSGKAYQLSWEKATKIDGYIIDRKNAKGEWENGAISLSADITEWKDNNPDSSSEYRIFCYSGNYISLSNESTDAEGSDETDSKHPPGDGGVNFQAYENPPEVIGAIAPEYPEFARRAKLQGTVVLEVEVLNDGSVKEIKVTRSVPGGLDDVAIAAVRKVKFKPCIVSGKRVDCVVVIPIEFNLSKKTRITKVNVKSMDDIPAESFPVSSVDGNQIVNLPALVFVQGGSFVMGSMNLKDEKPIHSVKLSSFYIGNLELTQKEWVEVMGSNPSYRKGDNLPVENVSWYVVVEYCNKRSIKEGLKPCYSGNDKNISCDWTANGYRLPTEAEWEFAASGGIKSKGNDYAGGNEINLVAWYDSNSDHKTNTVGTKAANILGIYDMSGNVWEWCWDWYQINYYKKSPDIDPRGSENGSVRVLRGGSWLNFKGSGCGVTNRYSDYPGNANRDVGFRLVKSAL